MSACNKTWREQYVTGERNVSIKTLHHRCDLQIGHDNSDAKKPVPCSSYTNPRPGFGIARISISVEGARWLRRVGFKFPQVV